MGDSKRRSIYKPKKSRRVSQKKLYKMPQNGGGILETFLGGNETEKSDSVPEKTNEEQTIESGEITEVQNTQPQPEPQPEQTQEDLDKSSDDKEKSFVGTMAQSISDTVGDVQDAFTQPAAEKTLDSQEAEIENMEPTPEAITAAETETIENLRKENADLKDKTIDLLEEIKQLQQKQIDSLTGTTPIDEPIDEVTDMSVDTPASMEGESMEVESPASMEGEPMDVESPASMEGESMDVDTPASMEGKPMSVESSPDTGSEYMDEAVPPGAPQKQAQQMGGTKRRKNKKRKTKRKRKGSKK